MGEKKSTKLRILTNGIIKENPVLVLLLGCCSALATSANALNGLGMGVSFAVVMILSNIFISLLRKVIPDNVRIPCYIVVIAGFVTIVQLLLQAFVPSLYNSLGLFIPLIVVNCIILGRAEMFANKNTVLDSALDGIGMSIGYTLVLGLMGIFREFFGSGTFFNIPILAGKIEGIGILNLAPGGFFTFAMMVAIVNWMTRDKAVHVRDFGEEESAIFAEKDVDKEAAQKGSGLAAAEAEEKGA